MAEDFDVEKMFTDTKKDIDQRQILDNILKIKKQAFILFDMNKLLTPDENLAIVQDVFAETLGKRIDALIAVWFDMWGVHHDDQHN